MGIETQNQKPKKSRTGVGGNSDHKYFLNATARPPIKFDIRGTSFRGTNRGRWLHGIANHVQIF
jgi:hypothetical protein